MADNLHTIQLGETSVTIINIGDVHEDVNLWFTLTEQERTQYASLLAQPARLTIYNVHFALPTASILVDAGAYDYPPDAPQLIPGYAPPPDLLTTLRTAAIQPEAITHVIITHAHGDHFNALTELRDGAYTPVFPNAQHYLGRGDWDAMQARLADATSLESRTFGVLHQQGQLQVVDQEIDLGHGVRIIPAPGESPGHQLVRLQSEGQTLYCIGDLYHLPAEVEQPHWTLPWNDAAVNQRSRAAFSAQASQEKALLIACHIPALGRIQPTAAGYQWVATTSND